MIHKTDATRLTPWLCATTLPLFAFSCASPGAQQPPWEGCRAASKTEYESPERDFLLANKCSARMQRQAIGGGVTIGIVVYSGWGDQLRAGMSLAGPWRATRVRCELNAEPKCGLESSNTNGAGTPIRGVSTQPLLDACRELKRMGADH